MKESRSELEARSESNRKASLMSSPKASRESKWWKSCWNGDQLDSDLLYRTIKAQQERRLAQRLLTSDSLQVQLAGQSSSSSSSPVVEPELSAIVDGSRQSYVYASPRPLPKVQLATSPKEQPDQSNPLSDPLYASVLGTSKQLQAINRLGSNVAQYSELKTRKGQISQQLICSELNDYSEPASRQLRSLVEKCLEVQRAARRVEGRESVDCQGREVGEDDKSSKCISQESTCRPEM